MRILVGTVEIASQVYNIADGFRKLGHQVTSAVLCRSHFYPHHTYDIVASDNQSTPDLDTLIELHDLFIYVWAERGLTSDKSEYQRIKERGKKIVTIFSGSDVRHFSAYRQLYGVPIDEIWEEEANDSLVKRLHNVRHEELYCDLIMSSPNSTPLSVRPYMQVYLPIILDRYECVIHERNIPVVIHAPSDKSVKGTDVIVQALERLHADGITFEFRLLHGVPNQEIQSELRNADVVIEQLYIPQPGMLGLEAMASGCAVASWNREEFDPLPTHRPVWFIDADTIYLQLKRLLTDKSLRIRLAKESRRFVETYHDHLKTCQGILSCVTEGISEYDHYPSFFLREYMLPAGSTVPKYLLDATTCIIKNWGVPADLDVRTACDRGLLSAEGLEPLSELPRWPVTPKTRTPQQRREDIQTRMNSAQDACSRGDTAAAREILSACITLYPYFSETYLALALIDIVHGEFASSRRNLNQLELLEPEHPGLADALRLLKSKEQSRIRPRIENALEQFDELYPKIFTVETTVVCELKCPECALGSGLLKRQKGVMPFEKFKIIADKIRPFRPDYLYLHMYGEPMLNPDIMRIINYASTFCKTNISTNGMAMTEKMAEDLITSGVTDIIVSIDGVTQEVYETYRKGGDVSKAFDALEMLLHFNNKYGNRVGISPQFVAFKHNQHEMEAFHNYCVSKGLAPLFKAPHLRKPTLYENSRYTELIRVPLPDHASQRHAMAECRDPREVFTIQMDGSVIACCYDYVGQTCFGNIFEQEVMDIWNSLAYREFRWNVISGNAPDFCVKNCLLYLCDFSQASPLYEKEYESVHSPGRTQHEFCDSGRNETCSCLFLNAYYTTFLTHFYSKNQHLSALPYDLQFNALQRIFFGDSDFYSHGLSLAGWKTQDLVINCHPLQSAWAREHEYPEDDLQSIMLEQIKRTRPSVVYFQEPNIATAELLREIRNYTDLLVLQIASAIPAQTDFSQFDVVITAAPHFVNMFRNMGVACYYQPLAFDPRCVPVSTRYRNRSIDVSFVGGFSDSHVGSYTLFEHLAVTTPVEFWGYGVETLPPTSAIRSRHHGEVWGREMFKVLANSKITVNRHGEIAEDYACNMRLFEATGSGALLVTEYKENLSDLFEIGREVVAYHTPKECADLINYYLTHPDEAEAIARAGQVRTLRDHTYVQRMSQMATILERHIRYRKERNLFAIPDLSKISYGYSRITEAEITADHIVAWQNPTIPAKQRALVQKALERMYKGEDMPAYRALANIIKPCVTNGTTILELGCSSGYCFEILEYYLNRQVDYSGVDYSQSMIDMACDYYPQATFYAADGAELFFVDQKFDIVISSCVLLHTPNWRQHVSETVRVAKKYVVVSRTPICRENPTHYMKKYAYDVETVELRFCETEIVHEFKAYGLELIDAIQYAADAVADEYEVTYLFKRT